MGQVLSKPPGLLPCSITLLHQRSFLALLLLQQGHDGCSSPRAGRATATACKTIWHKQAMHTQSRLCYTHSYAHTAMPTQLCPSYAQAMPTQFGLCYTHSYAQAMPTQSGLPPYITHLCCPLPPVKVKHRPR